MIYLDYAATTPTDPEVLRAMEPYWSVDFGNASSIHTLGRNAKAAIAQAKQSIANILKCEPDEIFFTSGGTESCNLGLIGIAKSNKTKRHAITSAIEHSAILQSVKRLESEGFEVTRLPVNSDGFVTPADLEVALREDTAVISIMYANNEIGSLQDIPRLSKIGAERGIPFHTDACQAASYLDLDVKTLGVSALSLSGSKIYGPKGIGLLYLKKNIEIQPQILGGGQQQGVRSGTEFVAGIIGLAKALEISEKMKKSESERLKKLTLLLLENLKANLEGVSLNGSHEQRLPNNLNISIDGIEGESLLVRLDSKGIAVSTGSACGSEKIEASHVLSAIGKNKNDAHSSLRLTLGRQTTEEDIQTTAEALIEIVTDLRKILSN